VASRPDPNDINTIELPLNGPVPDLRLIGGESQGRRLDRNQILRLCLTEEERERMFPRKRGLAGLVQRFDDWLHARI
jgi:hypothetical protein